MSPQAINETAGCGGDLGRPFQDDSAERPLQQDHLTLAATCPVLARMCSAGVSVRVLVDPAQAADVESAAGAARIRRRGRPEAAIDRAATLTVGSAPACSTTHSIAAYRLHCC